MKRFVTHITRFSWGSKEDPKMAWETKERTLAGSYYGSLEMGSVRMFPHMAWISHKCQRQEHLGFLKSVCPDVREKEKEGKWDLKLSNSQISTKEWDYLWHYLNNFFI